jgi:endonuclease G
MGAAFSEDFESGSKRAYAPGKVRLRSGDWGLDGALIGSSEADQKTGAASLRLAAGGHADMLFDLDELPDSVSFAYGPYGHDNAVRLSLWYSNDGGQEWKKLDQYRHEGAGSSDIILQLQRGYHAPIRFRLQNDGQSRVNVDDFGTVRQPARSRDFRSGRADRSGTAPASTASAQDNDHLLLGNPDNARVDPASAKAYLVRRPQYALSYNSERGTANWVSWHLSGAEQGNASRCNCFTADAALPDGMYRVQSSNYIGSGFDRGHICASDDRSRSPEDNAATFLMTNIAPQAPDLNQKCWRLLEEYARRLTEDGKELYVISGVYGEGGTGSKGPATRIGNGRITVPGHFWKIILVLPEGRDDLKRIDAVTEIIAVDMPNTQSAGRYDWQSFRSTVAGIEKASGLRFFSALPADVAKALRTK